MIREATLADMDRLTDLGRRFFNAAEMGRIYRFSEGDFRGLVDGLMDSPLACVFVDDAVTSVAAALMYPQWFDKSAMIAQEVLFWASPDAEPGTGERLLTALEEWAADFGASVLEIGTMPALRQAATARWLGMRGYEPDTAYLRKVL